MTSETRLPKPRFVIRTQKSEATCKYEYFGWCFQGFARVSSLKVIPGDASRRCLSNPQRPKRHARSSTAGCCGCGRVRVHPGNKKPKGKLALGQLRSETLALTTAAQAAHRTAPCIESCTRVSEAAEHKIQASSQIAECFFCLAPTRRNRQSRSLL